MVDYWDRLEAALLHSGKTLKALQAHLGVSYQAMKKVQDGKTKALTAENNARAARFLGVSGYWLATGEGEMIANVAASAEERQRAGAEHAVTETQKHYLPPVRPPGTSWPFSTITPADYSRLGDLQKGLVEGYTKRLLEESTPNKSLNGQRAA